MPRHIVICIDGTNNRPGGGYTNVQRMVRTLVRDEQQLTYYQPGVGTIEPATLTTRSGRLLGRLADSVSALMLQRHVCAAYRFLMAHWRDGDRLCLFGFSRGAFTARVLAGMLSKVGLLHPGFEEMVPFAWRTYREPTNHDAARRFRRHYARFIRRIHFLGLFDSVSSVGLPWLPKTFPLTHENLRVQRIRQALALDERRVMFVQNRWREAADSPRGPSDLRQVWFAGSHSDIGGGYPEAEAGLSLIPLAWMMREAQDVGLRFRPTVTRRLLGVPLDAHSVEILSQCHASASMHDEAARLGWRIIDWLPVPRRAYVGNGEWETEWIINRGGARRPPAGARVHESVRLREQGGGYTPRARLDGPRYEW
jgi:uncharacterized protein (DUF2235 family)